MDQEEKETGMQTENYREEERKEGKADREEYRKLCMERERELGRYETWFFDAKYSIISSGCLGIAAFVLFFTTLDSPRAAAFLFIAALLFSGGCVALIFRRRHMKRKIAMLDKRIAESEKSLKKENAEGESTGEGKSENEKQDGAGI